MVPPFSFVIAALVLVSGQYALSIWFEEHAEDQL
jgi:drug/metabolite transporter superfamily protein YnfA